MEKAFSIVGTVIPGTLVEDLDSAVKGVRLSCYLGMPGAAGVAPGRIELDEFDIIPLDSDHVIIAEALSGGSSVNKDHGIIGLAVVLQVPLDHNGLDSQLLVIVEFITESRIIDGINSIPRINGL